MLTRCLKYQVDVCVAEGEHFYASMELVKKALAVFAKPVATLVPNFEGGRRHWRSSLMENHVPVGRQKRSCAVGWTALATHLKPNVDPVS